MSRKDDARLLRWTSVREALGGQEPIPKSVAASPLSAGIEPAFWKDLIWNWRRYFGRSTCAGRSESMKSHAEKLRRHHKADQLQAVFVQRKQFRFADYIDDPNRCAQNVIVVSK